MAWPTLQDYNEAIQNPRQAFNDPALQSGQPELNQIGLPRPIAGNFACVYKIQTGGQRWAARCFSTTISDQQKRYEAISNYLAKVALPYTVPFTFLSTGIKVQGRNYPLLKMQWVQGESLHTFVGRSIAYPDTLLSLAKFWVKMMADLRAVSVAHGDLQHGNILVVGDQLCLIDYDGMFVPALTGNQSNELGHRNYQLPSRSPYDFGPYLDNFSAWVIYVSLVALAVHPELWNAHRGGDECLIFRKEDFVNPESSALLRDLNSSPNDQIRFLVELFSSLFPLSPQDVPTLDGNLPAIKIEPPKPWWVDFEGRKPETKIEPEPIRPAEEEQAVPDPGWIIDSLNAEKPITRVDFRSKPQELRIIVAGSIALALITRFFIETQPSEFLMMVSGVCGLNLLLCYIRYRNDPSHADFDVFKKESKNFLRKIREHQTFMDSISAERLTVQENLAKSENEVVEQKNRLATNRQAELAKLQADLNALLQSVNQRRQDIRTSEGNKMTSLQATLGNQISELDRKISDLRQKETDEKNTAQNTLQISHIQNYLCSHSVMTSWIPGIGQTYKSRLYYGGFQTAADINSGVRGVSGIGATRETSLMLWRQGLEFEARRSAPTLSAGDKLTIENKYRWERQMHEAAKQKLQTQLNTQVADVRQYFSDARQSLNQEEQQIRSANAYEQDRIQKEYNSRFAALDANFNAVRNKIMPTINELSAKLRDAQKQIFALRWKSSKHEGEGKRFAFLRFRDYLRKIISA